MKNFETFSHENWWLDIVNFNACRAGENVPGEIDLTYITERIIGENSVICIRKSTGMFALDLRFAN